MLFAVRFTDRPERLSVRKQYLEEHVAWLASQPAIVLVGPLREDPAAFPVGALWIVSADSREEVEALYAADPFWAHGLRGSVEILHWSKAVPDRAINF